MSLPKDIRSIRDAPWYSPKDLIVKATAHNVHAPIHPTLLTLPVHEDSSETKGKKAEECFFKLVPPGGSTSVSREIRNLELIKVSETSGLSSEGAAT